MWGDEKFLVCVLWGNNSHPQGVSLVLCKQNGLLVGNRRCMFCIQIRHNYFKWEVWYYILTWCLQGWPTQGSKHIYSHSCCLREWWDKSLINQCKWNEHRLWKWHCWEGFWMWWYQQLVCSFFLGNWLYFRQRWILHGNDIIFVVKNPRRCKGTLASFSLVIDLDE